VDADEGVHARWVLDRVAPKHNARVLSLGCGVAGMEAHWQCERPDMRFTLVNVSQAQLDMCLCDGELVRDSAETFNAHGQQWDVIVLAYMLGHVWPGWTLDHAMGMLAEGGTVLVLDVFDQPHAFTQALHYRAPSSDALRRRAFTRVDVPTWHMHWVRSLVEDEEVRTLVEASKPGMWVYP
jgi:2-polyprenyl-3-methyl-5-hydroxy-6-metoxy-1,4-benzoquinol methylase